MQIDLTGRVAVVTGAAQGIGEGTARCLAQAGASVLLSDIQAEKGEHVAASIRDEGGVAVFTSTDVSVPEQIQVMIDAAVSRFGRLDILVNNAHWEARGSALDVSAEDWDRSYAVLVRAPFLGAKCAIPHMRSAGGGVIINVSSVLGHFPSYNYVTYTSAKAAVIQLSRQLAVDFGPDGIRVNTITPGDIQTRTKEPVRDSMSAFVAPLRRSGVSADIAHAICFLVSDQASFITGEELVIDGGVTLPFSLALGKRAREWQEPTASR